MKTISLTGCCEAYCKYINSVIKKMEVDMEDRKNLLDGRNLAEVIDNFYSCSDTFALGENPNAVQPFVK